MHIVLSIPELLEQIFLYTDTTTLLTSTQRVCRLWNTIITQTPSLQRHLFFLPHQCPGHTGTQQDDHSPTVLTLNPHLRTIYPSWFPNLSALTDERGCRTSNLEPELLRVFEMDGDQPFERANASWRRMLLMQPPTLGVGFVSVQSLHERATVMAWRVTQDGKRWEWTVNRNAHGAEIGEAVELEVDQGQGGEGREMRELEPVTIGVFYELVVRNSVAQGGPAIMKRLLDNPAAPTIPEGVLAAAPGSKNEGTAVVQVLLDRSKAYAITEAVIKAAASNLLYGHHVLPLLLRKYDSAVPDKAVEVAKANRGY
ncbi:hypothetical protein BJY01DRAFT_242651 [Aspergillus pseudoustus]|uniref:F-box domain-containing protein n=1 Tax=Aspergillus pseudoustus TaxID=1810923 RepID=A0ABR4KWD5_9EURO